MTPPTSRFTSGRFFAALALFLGWSAQIIPLAAFSVPAEWKFETLQNASSEWWHTLSVQTVPGVVYHLQKSTTLAPEDWTNVSSIYGTGAEWICPIFPGIAPAAASPPGIRTLPATPPSPILPVYLILEKTTTGGTLISWSSLDDHTSRRIVIAGVTLDPVWDEFNAAYFRQHGSYFFAVSPRLSSPVTFSSGTPVSGPLDTAMLAAFTAALPTITENVQTSVTAAAHFDPHQVNPGAKAFYRFSADWGVDSDSDGRLDWQEIVCDGNNPFASDSDGDGVPDQAVGQGSGGGLPTPTDAQGPTPLAHIEQQVLSATRAKYDLIEPMFDTSPYVTLSNGDYWGAGTHSTDPDQQTLEAASTFPDFVQALEAINFRGTTWNTSLSGFSYGHISQEIGGGDFHYYHGHHARFRLKLDAPAPAGGYSIPLRLAKVVESIDPASNASSGITSVETVEILLVVAEGQTIGTPVDIPCQFSGENALVTFIPGSVELTGFNRYEGNPEIMPVDVSNGVCIAPAGWIDGIFNGNFNSIQEGTHLYWQKRRLNGAGGLGAWSFIYPPNPAEDQYEGDFVLMEILEPGIYQLQAVLSFSNGQQVEFPLVRMRNARSIVNSADIANNLLKAGQPDYFGVCPNEEALLVRNKAVTWLGSKAYRKDDNWVITDPVSDFNPDTTKSSKCNIFVTHVANKVGATTPYYSRWGGVYPAAPLAKEDWFGEPEKNVDLDAPGWKFQGVPASPTPGMSVASPVAGGDARSGHVGILDYDGSWINAGKLTVNKSVHLKDDSASYKPNNMRER